MALRLIYQVTERVREPAVQTVSQKHRSEQGRGVRGGGGEENSDEQTRNGREVWLPLPYKQ